MKMSSIESKAIHSCTRLDFPQLNKNNSSVLDPPIIQPPWTILFTDQLKPFKPR